MAVGHVVMGLLFFPRGGSAQVARYLAPALADAGWSVSLAAGSLGRPGESTHAGTFFEGIDVHALDYSAAVATFESDGGQSAVAAPVPMHPSYEDRPGVPDVVLTSVEPDLADHLAAVWDAPFTAAGAESATVAHLHHLTPQHDLVRRRWPALPVVAHLHGTEIKLAEAALAEPARWRHARFWLDRLRAQAAEADHVVVVSPDDRGSATTALGVEATRVTDVPNGVDVERFRPRPSSPQERRARFRRWLVEDPRGWREGGAPGSVSYGEDDLDHVLGPDGTAPVLLYVGRFTSAKRVPLLVRAFQRARARLEGPASLLVWGGHPGECEDEHPVTVARREGVEGVYFAGWRGHEDLPEGLAACDVLVMPSVNDSFPQTPLEAMATGLPVLATRSGGFPSMVGTAEVSPRPTGWLVAPRRRGRARRRHRRGAGVARRAGPTGIERPVPRPGLPVVGGTGGELRGRLRAGPAPGPGPAPVQRLRSGQRRRDASHAPATRPWAPWKARRVGRPGGAGSRAPTTR